MDRYNRKIKDTETSQVLDFIFQNAFGNAIILNNIPTSDQMKANTWGVYGTSLYIKFANNVLLKFDGTVIS